MSGQIVHHGATCLSDCSALELGGDIPNRTGAQVIENRVQQWVEAVCLGHRAKGHPEQLSVNGQGPWSSYLGGQPGFYPSQDGDRANTTMSMCFFIISTRGENTPWQRNRQMKLT